MRSLLLAAVCAAAVGACACGRTSEAESRHRGRAPARPRGAVAEGRRDARAGAPHQDGSRPASSGAAHGGPERERGDEAAASVPRTIVAAEPFRPETDPFDGARACRDTAHVAVTISPRRPTAGQALRVIAVADAPLPDATLVARGPNGLQPLAVERWGGPPWAWSASLDAPAEGEWEAGLAQAGSLLGCRRVRVREAAMGVGGGPGLWTAERGWDRGAEDLYSAWIEHLFDAPDEGRVAWRPLHELTRDRARNLLWNHLGLGEDDAARSGAIELPADCADVPYFLRAYFAWKLRLPFQWSRCDAESGWRAPVCTERFNNDLERTERTELASFQAFIAQLADTVHSGNMRALPTDELADFYSVTLTRQSLRPGTVFANPYGHVLVVSHWRPQAGDRPGALLAIDGNPDRSIGRKRFWRGAFAFGTPVWSGAAGFKAFRPIVARNGAFEALANREINAYAAYGNYSHEQYRHGADAFYAKVESLIDPVPLPPERAFEQTFAALVEMLQARVRAVALGAQWSSEHPEAPVAMPEGPEIFESVGAWEDYSTPSRDLSLLGAFDLLAGYAAAVEEHPERWGLAAGEPARDARARIEALFARRAAEATITYRRTDGSEQTLTVAELLGRSTAFEVAYNPNDCPEVRWGAPEGSPERATCVRRAPPEQQERMAAYRTWFHDRTRPRRI